MRRLRRLGCTGALAGTLGLLLAAPAWGEGSGVYSWLGNSSVNGQTTGGLFSAQPRGIAVNDTSGDVYVVDSANGRLQRFDAADKFVSAWGKDVDGTAVGTGYEICTVAENCKTAAASTGLGGEFSTPQGVAVNQVNGHVYVTESGANRVEEFTAAGTFVRAFGKDVVAAGAEQADEQQTVTVAATAGQYRLTFGAATTVDVEWNEPASGLEAKLNALATIGGAGGNVTVSGGPGGPGGPTPYLVAFGGSLADTNLTSLVVAAGTTLLTGSATVATFNDGADGFEVCANAASCKAGASGNTAGAMSLVASGNAAYPAIAPAGSPNAGDVLVPEPGNLRVQEFSADGKIIRAFGWDVVSAGPGNAGTGFEVCNAAALDICKVGVNGAGAGQFATANPSRIAESAGGSLYTVESTGNFRVQKFTLPGNVLTPQGEFDSHDLHGSSNSITSTTTPKDNVSEIAVDSSGYVYAVKAVLVGTGEPPVVIRPGALVHWQQRVFKIDPNQLNGAAEPGKLVETLAANPGFFATPNGTTLEGVKGLAVKAPGLPAYVTVDASTGDGEPRVYRLDEITGLVATPEPAVEVGATTATLRATINPATIPLDTIYRFEYTKDEVTWISVPIPDLSIGNGTAGGESSSCPTPKAAVCHVSQKISGLEPNATYHVRLVASTIYSGIVLREAAADFTTTPAPPATSTGAAHWSSPAATSPSLTIGGVVNPGHDRTTYYFQYIDEPTFLADQATGSGFEHAARVPLVPAEAGRGLDDVSVHGIVSGLDPAKAYRYRLVATNSLGSVFGKDRRVDPPGAEDRYYEWVSNGDSWGSGISIDVSAVGDDGNRAMFPAQAFGQPESVPGLGVPFISQRGASGWSVLPALPEPDRAIRELTVESMPSADLSKLLWTESSLSERERSEAQFSLVGIDGTRTHASQQLVPISRSGKGLYQVKGASADLSQIVFVFDGSGSVKFFPAEPMAASKSDLYAIEGAGGPSPELTIVNRADGKNGALIGGACGARLGGAVGSEDVAVASHAVSADGSVVYFSAFPGAPAGECKTPGPKRLYKRIDGEHTVEVSKSTCTRTVPACNTALDGDDAYRGASSDGSVVFFTSVRQLTDSDTDSTSDLYAYDETPPASQPKLVQVSAGETVGAHTAGSGAKVLGVLDNAADGSRVYFVAEGALTGTNLRGKTPASGARNLYVYERDASVPAGRIAFVGPLAAGTQGDQTEWEAGENGGKYAAALPLQGGQGDGRSLLFVSAQPLLVTDTDTSKDVYLYDDTATEAAKVLQCLSCAGNEVFEARLAVRPTVNFSVANANQAARTASEDLSKVVFSTQEKLLANDENSTWDVYMWQEGTLSLISAGTEGFGVTSGFKQAAISPDGRNVFFITRAPLSGGDTNNALDMYDARVGGGFPEQAQAPDCQGGAECQGPASTPPAPLPPNSTSTSGHGNVTPPPACKKSQVRKKGKCVKKPTHHKKKHKGKGRKHRAPSRAGAGR